RWFTKERPVGVGVAGAPTAVVAVSTGRPLRKKVSRRRETSISIRVRTCPIQTAPARIHPIDPFGRIGSSARSHRGLQSRPLTTPRTPKTFGTPFEFTLAKDAKGAPPGGRNARRELWATA